MQLPNPQPDTLAALTKELKAQTAELLAAIKPHGEVLVVTSNEDVFGGLHDDLFFLIKSGEIICRQQDKIVYTAEPGDVIGLFRAQNMLDGQFECENSAELIPYKFSALQMHCEMDSNARQIWLRFLVGLSCYFNQALAHEIPKQFKPATGFLQFEEGDVIINQGEQAECVYTLLEGSAIVTHNGIKVGEINAEETFGAMALFTKQARNATVTASSSCSVLAVRKDEFLDLVSHQPQVCMGLIEEMADKINQLNQQVLKLQ